MSKAEKFICEYTNNCYNYNSYAQDPIPWLTPDQARKVVEIAREEIMEKVCNLLSKMIWEITYEDLDGNSIHNHDKVKFIKYIKQAMKDG